MKSTNDRKRAVYTPRQGGFTLVEILVSLALVGLVAAGIYGVYNLFFKQSTIRDMVLEAQQNARAAMNIMERELLNAGYFVGAEEALSEATATSIEFVYTDPSTAVVSTTSGKRLRVKYATLTESGVTYLTRKEDNITDGITGSTRKIIDYVSSFTVTYYDIDGNTIAAPITVSADRLNVRFVTIELTTRTKDNIPGTAAPETFTLRTNLRLRNLGIGLTAADITPPSAPTGLQVRDPGICGRLKVKWTESPEGDVDGYRIYYGPSTGTYPGVINVPLVIMSGSTYSCSRSGSSITCEIFPTSVALAHTPSDGTSDTPYYFAVKAYDKNFNASAYSTEVTGAGGTETLTGSNSSFGSGSDDSTVNAVKSGALTSISGVDGPSDGQVLLSWPLYDLTTNPGVEKLRIYRSDTAFTYPIDVSKFVAEVAPTDTSYTDTTPGLLGCAVYKYAIAPVNCDTTLVPDNDAVEYGNDSKYVSADYTETSGDGTGPATDSPSGSDTAPPDTVVPGAPTIGVRAGWKRVAVSLTQPADADLDQTCTYVNLGTDYPDLLTDTATYPLNNGCYQIGPTTPGARLIPNSDGIFTTSELSQGATTSFWHNDWNTVLGSGVEPNLAESGTYSYRAVAFDLCENGSVVTDAQDTTNLCGEDPKVADYPTNAFDHPKPPAVTGASASCCDEITTCCEAEPPGVVLSWTGVSSNTALPSSPTNPYDLAGYRIFRGTSAVDWSAAVLVNPISPVWGSQFTDTGISDGGEYYYRIVTTDCPYERTDPTEATIRSDMISNVLHSTIVGPVKPGMLDRDEKCPGAGACTKDDHREVLTGVDIDKTLGGGTGVSTPSSTFTHDTVTMFFDNTSAGQLTITKLSLSWVSSSAELAEIIVGGGRSSKGAQSTIVTASPGSASAPFTRSVTDQTVNNGDITAGDRYVPVTFRFEDSVGDPVDMRDDQLLIELDVTNDATGTTECVSYLTVSKGLEGVNVPVGPVITTVLQDNPSTATFSFPVPGPDGLNTVPTDGTLGSIQAIGVQDVKVSALVVPSTLDESTGGTVGTSTATLFWVETAITVGTAPATGFTTVAMTDTGGNIWEGTIPARDTTVVAKRVWFYVLAEDDDGNFDRSPEIDEGFYTYDQKPFDACEVTPSAPSVLEEFAFSGSGSDVSIRWLKVDTYTGGTLIDKTADPIVYQVWRRDSLGGSFTKLFEVADDELERCFWTLQGDVDGAGPATASYDAGTTCVDLIYYYYWRDTVDTAANDLTYYIIAENSCDADTNTSAKTNFFRECVGSASAVISAEPSTLNAGSSYTVTVNDCLLSGNLGADTITVKNIATTGNINLDIVLTEDAADTGIFTGTLQTTADIGEAASKVYVSAGDAAPDTITVSCPVVNGCTGPPTPATVTVNAAPCDNTPSAPTGLAGVKAGADIDLSWTANPEADIAFYNVYRKKDAGAFELIAQAATGSDPVTYSDRPSQINSFDYSYYVTAVDTCSTPLESAASGTVGPF